MEKEKRAFLRWVKRHKMQLIIAGVSITAVLAIILGIKNRETLEEVWASLKKRVKKAPEKPSSFCKTKVADNVSNISIAADNSVPTTRSPHNVSGHIRNLPTGHKPSAAKVALAAERGLELRPGQTIVDSYSTGGAVA